jgi:hypothetical protein
MQKTRQERGEDISNAPPLWFWKESFYRWGGVFWEKADNLTLEVTKTLQQILSQQNITGNFVNDVLLNLKAKTQLHLSIDRLPVRIAGRQSSSAEACEMITFRNGTLDVSNTERED